MKKFSQLFLVLISTLGFSQCEITGKSSLAVGEKSSYNIKKDAQCKECYRWASTGGIVVESDNRLDSVEIMPVNAGNSTLYVQYISENGNITKCSKDISILAKEDSEETPAETAKKEDCDIDVTNYETRKISNDRLGFFSNSSKDFSYTWEVLYKNGQKQYSTEKAPQFSYSKDNQIVTVSVTVVSKSCYKKFTKPYDDNFWKFF